MGQDLGTPLIGLVTDRRRLASSLGRPDGEALSLLITQLEAAARAGVSFAIIREPDLAARDLAVLVRRVRDLVRATAMRVLVNDRLDVAIAAGANGAHLRERSFTAAEARSLAPDGFLLGRSVHDAAGARDAGPVDYLLAGTMFPSMSKPGLQALLGAEGLSAVVAASAAPVLAIGGIATAEQVGQVRAAGAAGVAAVGGFQPASLDDGIATAVQNCAHRLRSGFDLSGGVS